MAEDLASAITEAAGQPATVRVGEVVSVNPLRVSLGGTPLNMDAVGVIGGAPAAAGGPVALLGQGVQGGDSSGASWLVLGSPGKGTLYTAQTDVSVYLPADTQNKADAAFSAVVVGGVPLMRTVSKTRTESRIACDLRTSCYGTVGGSGVKYGINVSNLSTISIDHECASFFINPALTHLTVTGFIHVPGSETYPPGDYQITLGWRRYSGVDTLNMNADDRISLRLTEVD